MSGAAVDVSMDGGAQAQGAKVIDGTAVAK